MTTIKVLFVLDRSSATFACHDDILHAMNDLRVYYGRDGNTIIIGNIVLVDYEKHKADLTDLYTELGAGCDYNIIAFAPMEIDIEQYVELFKYIDSYRHAVYPPIHVEVVQMFSDKERNYIGWKKIKGVEVATVDLTIT